jgi:hypothetical protein
MVVDRPARHGSQSQTRACGRWEESASVRLECFLLLRGVLNLARWVVTWADRAVVRQELEFGQTKSNVEGSPMRMLCLDATITAESRYMYSYLRSKKKKRYMYLEDTELLLF